MKEWPSDNKLIPFDSVIEDLMKVLDPVVKVYDETELPFYKGYNIGEDERVCSFDPAFSLSKEGMEYHHEHGRNVLEVALGIAFQLGIEQGRRMAKDNLYLEGVLRGLGMK